MIAMMIEYKLRCSVDFFFVIVSYLLSIRLDAAFLIREVYFQSDFSAFVSISNVWPYRFIIVHHFPQYIIYLSNSLSPSFCLLPRTSLHHTRALARGRRVEGVRFFLNICSLLPAAVPRAAAARLVFVAWTNIDTYLRAAKCYPKNLLRVMPKEITVRGFSYASGALALCFCSHRLADQKDSRTLSIS